MIPLFSHFVFQLHRIWMRIYHIITASSPLGSQLCLLHETVKHCILYIFFCLYLFTYGMHFYIAHYSSQPIIKPAG